jgi:DNA-binding ferritin-like protein (Dps family)
MTVFISKLIGGKRRWRRYRTRVKALPKPYRTAVEAIERYNFGRADGARWAEMLEDLADLFEQAAANGTPIREIVGEDPVAFGEVFMQNYPEGQWVVREQERLRNTIARAAGEGTRNDERAV